MNNRLKLQQVLENILGSKNVYYQSPSTVKMEYPAIIYKRSTVDHKYANNNTYKTKQQYTITVVDADPDSVFPLDIAYLPTAKHNTSFTKDNLYHDVYTIYY